MTPKIDRFCREYVIDLDATKAAIRAGYAVKAAKQRGYKLLQREDVQELVSELQASINSTLRMTATELLEKLIELERCDIGDLYDSATGRLLDVHEMPRSVRRYIQKIEYTKDGLRLHLVDRVRLLELMGRHIEVSAWAANLLLVKDDEIEANILAGRARARAARDGDDDGRVVH